MKDSLRGQERDLKWLTLNGNNVRGNPNHAAIVYTIRHWRPEGTGGLYAAMQTVMGAANVWPLTSWKQQTVPETLPAAVTFSFLYCLLWLYIAARWGKHCAFLMRVFPSLTGASYNSKGPSEMGHSPDETLCSWCVGFTWHRLLFQLLSIQLSCFSLGNTHTGFFA